MAYPIKIVASEILVFCMKKIPVVGDYFDVWNSIRSSREMLQQKDRLADLESRLTRIEVKQRDFVGEKSRTTPKTLSRPGLTGRELDRRIRSYPQFQGQGLDQSLLEGLLRNDSQSEELKRVPEDHGKVLPPGDIPDPEAVRIIFDDSNSRILESAPDSFSRLLLDQNSASPPLNFSKAIDTLAVPGNQTPITPTKGRVGEGVQWGRETFLAALSSRTRGETEGRIASRILDWSSSPSVTRIYWGKGSKIGGFVPVVHHKGADHFLFNARTDGTIRIEWSKTRPKHDTLEMRAELLTRLNRIDSIRLPLGGVEACPTFPTLALESGTRVSQFLSSYEWYINEIKSS